MKVGISSTEQIREQRISTDGCISSVLSLLQDCADSVREDVTECLTDKLGIAMHQVDEQRIESLQGRRPH